MEEKTCKVMKSLTGDMYAVTKLFNDGSTSDRYKYKVENWGDVQQFVLQPILEPLGVDPKLWSLFVNGKAKIVPND